MAKHSIVWFQKIPKPTTKRVNGNSKGESSLKTTFQKQRNYKLKPEIQGDCTCTCRVVGEANPPKKHSVGGGVDFFWNNTPLRLHLQVFGCFSVTVPFSLQVKLFSLLPLLLPLPVNEK